MLRCAILIVLCIVCAIKDNRTSHTPNYIYGHLVEKDKVCTLYVLVGGSFVNQKFLEVGGEMGN